MSTGTVASRLMRWGLAAAWLALGSSGANSADLQPHLAIYDMELVDAEEGSGISEISGRMVYEFTGNTCEGHAITVRFMMIMTSDMGMSQVTDLRISSFETAGGESLRFLTRSFVDSSLAEEVRGTATREAQGTSVRLKQPSGQSLEFSKDVMFPTEHLSAVIDAAQRGERFLSAKVFDGSEAGSTLFETSTVMTPVTRNLKVISYESKLPVAEPAEQLWRISSAYFNLDMPEGVSEQTPDYELQFLMDSRGIARELKLDYGTFMVSGTLVNLRVLNEDKCQ
ncbi:DUF1849 family protein [Pseudovibrio exalbescens]|uniref:EipB family protein n=1 Tax=Pseudovibrio exalbescens TaxID=197461 RepID=UPI002366CC12|nr:DUF1849 family protein [Pseudovibrio exalbescens]MDD7910686.1 DUF1849 family protein [Pseudovibrio exalbescens]